MFVKLALGFTAAGVTAGSVAAGLMSSAAIANGGGVAVGSLVAVLQSAGVVGFSASTLAGLGAGGAAVGGAIGGLAAHAATRPIDNGKNGKDNSEMESDDDEEDENCDNKEIKKPNNNVNVNVNGKSSSVVKNDVKSKGGLYPKNENSLGVKRIDSKDENNFNKQNNKPILVDKKVFENKAKSYSEDSENVTIVSISGLKERNNLHEENGKHVGNINGNFNSEQSFNVIKEKRNEINNDYFKNKQPSSFCEMREKLIDATNDDFKNTQRFNDIEKNPVEATDHGIKNEPSSNELKEKPIEVTNYDIKNKKSSRKIKENQIEDKNNLGNENTSSINKQPQRTVISKEEANKLLTVHRDIKIRLQEIEDVLQGSNEMVQLSEKQLARL